MNESKDINVTITSGTIIKTVLLLILLAVLYYIKDIVLVVLASVVIASAIEPATHWCARHRIRRLPAVIGIYFILAVVLGLLFVYQLFYL